MQVQKPKPGYKTVKSLFGKYEEIPEEWTLVKIKHLKNDGKIKEIQDGNHGELHPKSKDFVTDGIPFITSEVLSGNKLDFDNCKFLPKIFLKKLRIGFAKPCDVLLSHKGSIGFTSVLPENYDTVILSPQVTYYRLSKEIFPKFLFFIFQSYFFQKQLSSSAKQSTRDYVGITNQETLVIPQVPKIEQQKIVSILSNIDNLIDSYGKAIEGTSRLKRGLMQTLLTKGIGHKKFKKVKWYYNKQKQIPIEWQIVKLSSLCTLFNGIAFKPEDWKKSGTPIIRIQNLNNPNAKFNYYEKTVDKNLYVKNGDVLFSWAGNLGTSIGSFVWNRGKGILNQHIFKVVPKSSVDSLFLYNILRSFVKEIEQKTHGAARQIHIRKGELYSRMIPLPPKNEQIQIVSILSGVTSKINDLKLKKSNLEKIKKGLMQKLLTGQIRV